MAQGSDPRSTLLQALPQAGWECAQCRREATDRLWALMQAKHPHVDETAARNRFALLLHAGWRLLALGMADGRKPTTWLRDQLRELLALPDAAAVALLQQRYPVLPAGDCDDGAPPYVSWPTTLTCRSRPRTRAFGRTFSSGLRTSSSSAGGATLSFVTMEQTSLQASPGAKGRSGRDPDLVAEALYDLTDKRPARSVSVEGLQVGQDVSWGIAFFRAFASLITPAAPEFPVDGHDKPKVWRRALERLSLRDAPPAGQGGIGETNPT